jgi:hypothetical protein
MMEIVIFQKAPAGFDVGQGHQDAAGIDGNRTWPGSEALAETVPLIKVLEFRFK